jgi:hypothetical protein
MRVQWHFRARQAVAFIVSGRPLVLKTSCFLADIADAGAGSTVPG